MENAEGNGFGLWNATVRSDIRNSICAGEHCKKNIHAGRHCDPRDARLAVRLCTTDGAPADCVGPNHQNQGGPKSQCGHYPGKRRVRGRDGVVRGVAWDRDS